MIKNDYDDLVFEILFEHSTTEKNRIEKSIYTVHIYNTTYIFMYNKEKRRT